ncbi:Tetratricopeptide-like helical [Penicillium cf. griseofulvum]|nr:Tetratricopeptide-like helical [Penicillium cf. griseofulvum]
MVFKPFTHLARQSFTKAFTHGYAQSVVAASQSYASTTPFNALAQPAKFSRTTQLQNAFANPSSSSGAGAKASQGGSGNGDLGLAAYYAAWQNAQTGDDSDWTQFEFKRRIGWKPSAEEADNVHEDRAASDVVPPHPTKAAVNEDVSAQVEEAVAREIQIQEEQAQAEEAALGAEPSVEPAAEDVVSGAVSEANQIASDRIVRLANSNNFAEIPAAFEILLREGYTPTVEAYNVLLVAAIRLHPDVAQAIPKALDVYSDMLRRRVIPDEVTYETLVELLITRAHDIIKAKEALEQERVRFGGMEEPGKFMLQSSELERDLLAEDTSLSIAVKLFDTATTRHSRLVFPLEMYRHLIIACAKEGKVEDMIRIYAHMESQKVTPHATIFPSMITAFASTGDLRSAVECYNEYRGLAVSDDSGVFSIVQRQDGQVYAALIRAYLSCGKEEGAMQFLDRIRSSFDEVIEGRQDRWSAVEDVIVEDAFVQHSINTGEHSKALEQAKNQLHDEARSQAISRICIAAADAGDLPTASEAYDSLPTAPDVRQNPAISLLALQVRQGNVSAARSLWIMLNTVGQATPDLVQPTAMYAVALLKSGNVEEGLHQARNMFKRIRTASQVQHAAVANPVREQITESLHLFGRVLMQSAVVLSPQSSMTLLWSMLENGGLVSPLAEHAVANLGPIGISQLKAADLTLALQVQAGMLVSSGSMLFDVAHPVRFAHMLDVALSSSLPLDVYTTGLVDQAVGKLFVSRPDVVKKWQDHLEASSQASTSPSQMFLSSDRQSPVSMTETSITTPSAAPESFDPYAHATDFRGSAIIAEELEKTSGRAETHLNDALTRLNNMRRIGRHPRYITYAKLITAAAKAGRMTLAHDIHNMARTDVPLDMNFSVVKYGWVSILDAMVAACLTLGDRKLAAQYHQELLTLGSAPSANTFGLYITTLKESTKTFDEATEALKIFHRAIAEGVEPTSFLYNALIGKLGKARRIDDCLAYFAEMRGNNVRPTSVTYGTIVNALCRVSDERFAEEMFEEMESMPNYKPRPAPYNSMIQYFLNTKRDISKVLAYYERMQARNIQPTLHTYKLLIDAHASLEPVNMAAAEAVLDSMKAAGHHPDAVHYASLVHAKGCVLHDLAGARKVFDTVVSDRRVRLQPCLYQALFESMVANHRVTDTEEVVQNMFARKIEMTAYIANTLIHGWAAEGNVSKAKAIYDSIGIQKREPSTYEAMTRAFLSADDRASAATIVQEMMSRGYPSAVAGKIVDLIGGASASL